MWQTAFGVIVIAGIFFSITSSKWKLLSHIYCIFNLKRSLSRFICLVNWAVVDHHIVFIILFNLLGKSSLLLCIKLWTTRYLFLRYLPFTFTNGPHIWKNIIPFQFHYCIYKVSIPYRRKLIISVGSLTGQRSAWKIFS